MTNLEVRLGIVDSFNLFRTTLISHISSTQNFNIIVEADSRTEFIKQAEQCLTPPDICIIEIAMPGMSGYEVLFHIKRKWPETKILILTLFRNEYGLIRSIQYGINGYLLKDCTWTELLTALLKIYANGFYYSDFFNEHIISSVKDNTLTAPKISKREKQFLLFCTTDLTYAEISEKMGVSIKTVDCYRTSLFSKLHLNNRIDLAKFSIKNGIYLD